MGCSSSKSLTNSRVDECKMKHAAYIPERASEKVFNTNCNLNMNLKNNKNMNLDKNTNINSNNNKNKDLNNNQNVSDINQNKNLIGGIKKIKAMKILKSIYQEISRHPIVKMGLTVGLKNEDNIFEWKCTMIGAKDSSYKGGFFYLNVKFPFDFPESPHEICFITPIYHVNINPYKKNINNPIYKSLGYVRLPFVENWKPENSIKDIFLNIYLLFYSGNPYIAYDKEIENEYLNDKIAYEKKIKYFTQKYAYVLKAQKNEYDSGWDFSIK
jgi:ubiquitin-protein ligase